MKVLVTGGTGYIGARLVPALVARGHDVRVLARPGSRAKVPAGCDTMLGNALDADNVRRALRGGDTLVHLVGTPHPGPGKGREFRAVDLPSIQASVAAARAARVAQIVYVSVAQPAPVMQDYVAVRAAGE